MCATFFKGDLIKAIARRIIFLPVMRFVDDFFAAERKDCAHHSMRIFARCVLDG